jgi:hypothetical protein
MESVTSLSPNVTSYERIGCTVYVGGSTLMQRGTQPLLPGCARRHPPYTQNIEELPQVRRRSRRSTPHRRGHKASVEVVPAALGQLNGALLARIRRPERNPEEVVRLGVPTVRANALYHRKHDCLEPVRPPHRLEIGNCDAPAVRGA